MILGIPVGYGFSYYINIFVATDLTRLPFVVDPSTWLWTVGLGAVFTAVGYLPVYRAVRQLDRVRTGTLQRSPEAAGNRSAPAPFELLQCGA